MSTGLAMLCICMITSALGATQPLLQLKGTGRVQRSQARYEAAAHEFADERFEHHVHREIDLEVVLEVRSDPRAVALITLSAILAATGYGILLGTLSRTYEQLSMVGPISIVIAAALGGIMVPVYAMPEIMRKISSYSPLAWGHEAYLNVFVRGGHLNSVLWQIAALLGFFVLTLVVSWIGFLVRCRNGG